MAVLRPWVETLTYQMQGTLLTAIRGPDNEAKESPSKPVVRAYRAVVLMNARNFEADDKFMGNGSGIIPAEDYKAFFSSIDQYPFHWFMHFTHSAEIIGYFHPNGEVRGHWRCFYVDVCHALHLNPQDKMQLELRLRGNGHVLDTNVPCKCGSKLLYGPVWGRCANCLARRYDLDDD